MANKEQVARLKAGVEEWNKWRKENPAEAIDLQEANLLRANLQEADLGEANLQGADLGGVDMTNTNLERANLAGAVLRHVVYRPEHNSLDDRSELALLDRRDRWLNWSGLRSIGQVPLFGVSYVSLILSLAVVNGTDFLNRWLPVWLEWLADSLRTATVCEVR